MSHNKLRDDKECENCGDYVEKKFCPSCGQKNIETRQTFPVLIGHFAEDLTHYDTAFWKSLKHLLFRPGRLTRIYLEGKRQQYVPPVKLYIFISFITFLIPAILPDFTNQNEADRKVLNKVDVTIKEAAKTSKIIFTGQEVHSQKELDSLRALPEGQKVSWIDYNDAKIELKFKNGLSWEKIGETIVNILPKVLFLYMPIFTFWIWLFHGKRRWYFFDHGIFTLHYFSFLLLLFTIIYIFSWIFKQTGLNGLTTIPVLIYLFYPFFYFFRSHRRMYGESRLVSRLKSFIIFMINMICIVFVVTGVVYYILLNVN